MATHHQHTNNEKKEKPDIHLDFLLRVERGVVARLLPGNGPMTDEEFEELVRLGVPPLTALEEPLTKSARSSCTVL